MTQFFVTWEIDIECEEDNFVQAAREALKIMTNPGEAVCFKVIRQKDKKYKFIDLMEEDGEDLVDGQTFAEYYNSK